MQIGDLSITVIYAFFIALVFAVAGWFVVSLLGRAARRPTDSVGRAVMARLRIPLGLAIWLAGLYSVSLILPVTHIAWRYLSQGLLVALGLVSLGAVTSALITVIDRYQQRVDTSGEGGLASRTLGLLRIVVVIVAIAAALLVALDLVGLPAKPVTDWLTTHGARLLLIPAMAVAAVVAVARAAPRLVATAAQRHSGESGEEFKKRAHTLSRVAVNATQIVILIVAFFMLLSELGLDIAPILAGLGVAGIAIGFGAQSLVKDLLAGLFVILENQYGVGDVVRIAGVAGLVEDVNLRRTVLRDLDGIVHCVPNGEIRVASNLTREYSRVNMNIQVAYRENLDHVISVINRVGAELAKAPAWASAILKAPQALRVNELGPSGIEIKIVGDTKSMRQWEVMGELRKRLKEAFDAEGIEIPWQHTKAPFDKAPDVDRNNAAGAA